MTIRKSGKNDVHRKQNKSDSFVQKFLSGFMVDYPNLTISSVYSLRLRFSKTINKILDNLKKKKTI